MISQIAQQLSGLPIQIIFLSNGCVAFQRMTDFATIVDTSPQGDIKAIISNENMLIGSTEVSYNVMVEYKHLPEVKQWLVDQNMISPIQ